MQRLRKFNWELFTPAQDFESKYSAEREKERLKYNGYKVRITKEVSRWGNRKDTVYMLWTNTVPWSSIP